MGYKLKEMISTDIIILHMYMYIYIYIIYYIYIYIIYIYYIYILYIYISIDIIYIHNSIVYHHFTDHISAIFKLFCSTLDNPHVKKSGLSTGHAVTAVGYDDFKECFIVA